MTTRERAIEFLKDACFTQADYNIDATVRLIAAAEERAALKERVACIHIADEMQRMAENPYNQSSTNQRHNMRLRSEARMAKSIKEKIIDRTPYQERTRELITGKPTAEIKLSEVLIGESDDNMDRARKRAYERLMPYFAVSGDPKSYVWPTNGGPYVCTMSDIIPV
jgi:hypothetical protein